MCAMETDRKDAAEHNKLVKMQMSEGVHTHKSMTNWKHFI